MSSIAPSPAETSPVEIDPGEEKRLRARARRRASFCPGAGWALLGYGKRGSLVLISVAICWAALIWLVATLSPASIWTASMTTLFAFVVWGIELLDIGWCVVRPLPTESVPTESVLVRRFGFTTFTVWIAALIVPLLTATRFGMTEIAGDGMTPTIAPGERLIFHRFVADGDLKEGSVLLYRVSPQANAAPAGELVVGRVLAAPDDELSAQGGHYLVNGQVSRYRTTIAKPAKLGVPDKPKVLAAPDERYFVVQDCQTSSVTAEQLDSQQIGWVRRIDIVSTRLFHFGNGGLLRPVK